MREVVGDVDMAAVAQLGDTTVGVGKLNGESAVLWSGPAGSGISLGNVEAGQQLLTRVTRALLIPGPTDPALLTLLGAGWMLTGASLGVGAAAIGLGIGVPAAGVTAAGLGVLAVGAVMIGGAYLMAGRMIGMQRQKSGGTG